MRIIALPPLNAFALAHPPARQPLLAWIGEAKAADWSCPQDVKDRYANASFIENNRVVFNIKGNDYRLIVAVAYVPRALFVKFIGTHAEYDRIDAATVEMDF